MENEDDNISQNRYKIRNKLYNIFLIFIRVLLFYLLLELVTKTILYICNKIEKIRMQFNVWSFPNR